MLKVKKVKANSVQGQDVGSGAVQNPQEANLQGGPSVKNNTKMGGGVVAPEKDPGMAKKLQGNGLKGAIRSRMFGKKQATR